MDIHESNARPLRRAAVLLALLGMVGATGLGVPQTASAHGAHTEAPTVETSVVPSAATPAPGLADPTPVPVKWDMLGVSNWFRAHVGRYPDGKRLPPLTWSANRARTAQNHANYLAYLDSVGSTYCGHDEDPAFPATNFGDRTHNLLFCGVTNLTEATEGWLATPLHGAPILTPDYGQIGGATSAAASVAGVDNYVGDFPIRYQDAYVYPAPNGVLPLTKWWGSESPDPSAHCTPIKAADRAGRGPINGAPIFVFPARQVDNGGLDPIHLTYYIYLGHQLSTSDGSEVPSCYMNWDEHVAAGDNVYPWDTQYIFPRQRLENEQRLTATVRLQPVDYWGTKLAPISYAWSFDVIDYAEPTNVSAKVLTDGRVEVTWTPPTKPNIDEDLYLQYSLDGGKTVQVAEGQAFSIYDGRAIATGLPSGTSMVLSPSSGAAWSNEITTPTARFVGETPVRLLDSRRPGSIGRVANGESFRINVGTSDPVALNLTAVTPTFGGWAAAFPCGETLATTSNVNFQPGVTIANFTIVEPDGAGNVCFTVGGAAPGDLDVVVDRYGHFYGGDYRTQTPRRIVDTRTQGTPLLANSSYRITGFKPNSTQILNLTVQHPQGPGYLTVYPCASSRPTASAANYGDDMTRAALTLATADANGAVCIYSHRTTSLIVDLFGQMNGTSVNLARPTRLMDSRTGLGGSRGKQFRLRFPNVGARSVALTVTSTESAGGGFVTVYPCAAGQPTASILNYTPGFSVPNMVVITPDKNGEVCFASWVTTDLVVDHYGYLGAG